jgi:hypothetical protein
VCSATSHRCAHWSSFFNKPSLKMRSRAGVYRFKGSISRILAEWDATSSKLYFRCTRWIDAGCFTRETPGRHSVAGRIGLGTNPPPQFGQTLCSFVSTHSAQNVHSYEQIRASAASGGKSLSQYSQFGRSCNAMGGLPLVLRRGERTFKVHESREPTKCQTAFRRRKRV